jgi:hypothetical protein
LQILPFSIRSISKKLHDVTFWFTHEIGLQAFIQAGGDLSIVFYPSYCLVTGTVNDVRFGQCSIFITPVTPTIGRYKPAFFYDLTAFPAAGVIIYPISPIFG